MRIELFPGRAVDNNNHRPPAPRPPEVLSCQSDILFFSNDCHGVLHLALKKGVKFFFNPWNLKSLWDLDDTKARIVALCK